MQLICLWCCTCVIEYMYPVTVLLDVLGQLLVFLSDLAVLLFSTQLYCSRCAHCCILGQMKWWWRWTALTKNKVSPRERRDDMPPSMAVRRWQKSRRIYVRPRTGPQSAHLWWPAVAKLQAASVPIAWAAALWDRQTDGSRYSVVQRI